MCKKHNRVILVAGCTFVMLSLNTAPFFVKDKDRGTQPNRVQTSLNDFLGGVAHAKEKPGVKTKWTCPMHPHYIADEFGTCPICGMDLVKLQTTDNPDAGSEDKEAKTRISISPELIQTMGLRIAPAEKSQFGRRIRSYGIVEENERLRTVLSARVEGWIQTLNITAVGDQVNKGDILFELFSPELVVSQNDYLSTLKGDQQGRRGTVTRLVNFGVQPKAIEKLKRAGKAMENVPFYADQGGTVSELMVNKGTYVKRGETIAKIQDYSSVWVVVNVSEKDLGFITKKTTAQVIFPNLPEEEISATVDYIYPTVNSKTRTGKVRLVVDNKEGKLRPGAYADVIFSVNSQNRLSVPSEALLRNENGSFVVVSLGEGRFEPRRVQTGFEDSTRSEIKSGVKDGEKIVVSGQFLIDSESSLRESFRKLERLQLPLNQLKPDKDEMAMIDHMVDAALYIHEALVDGNDVEPKYLDPALAIKNILWSRYKNTKLSYILTDAESAIKIAQSAKTKTEQKEALVALVKSLTPWMNEGAPDHYSARKVIYFKEQGTERAWIQTSEKVANPYSNKSGDIIPWNTRQQESNSPKISKQEHQKKDMRGSHGG